MIKRGQNKNKFLKIITMPLKILGKARDLYMRSITGYATRTHYSSAGTVSVPFPRSQSSSSATFGDDYSELMRAASVRSFGHKNEIDMFISQQQQQCPENRVARGGLPKSSSVGMTMAKIDEEDDQEGSLKNQNKAADFLYPRSRTYAVAFRGSKF